MKKISSVICTLIIFLMIPLFTPVQVFAAEYPPEYKELLEEMRDAIENKGLNCYDLKYQSVRDQINNMNLSPAAKSFFLSSNFYYTSIDLSHLRYSTRDLDDNGIPELMLSFADDSICSMFTIQDGTPILIREFMYHRDRGYVYGSYLYNCIVGGAGYHTYNYCVLKGTDFIAVDGYKDVEGTLYDINDNRISKSKAEQIDAKYHYLDAPVWHMLIPGLFSDVDYSGWYSEPVIWAANKDITNGTSETEFSPDASCTRAQMVTFLWRSQGCPESGATNAFIDVDDNAYYSKAVRWAMENNITRGTSENTFSPDATVSRAQTVTFLWRMKGSDPVVEKNPFSDVERGTFYYDAVLWAVEENITKGTSEYMFSPDDPCTRAQIVTFLYRALCPERFNLEVSSYFKSPERLQSALTMEKTDPWNLGGQSYQYDGFYVEMRDRAFSMKNIGNREITLYGVTLGDSKQAFTETLSQNGWLPMGETQDNWTDYGTVIAGEAYYLQLTEDDSGAIIMWYINNWPQGDYDDFYSQFD